MVNNLMCIGKWKPKRQVAQNFMYTSADCLKNEPTSSNSFPFYIKYFRWENSMFPSKSIPWN